jgi:hypothetical protein
MILLLQYRQNKEAKIRWCSFRVISWISFLGVRQAIR